MNKHKGFTIVELIVVIVVIAILAAITIVAYTTLQAKANDSRRIQDVTNLQKSIEIYLHQNGQLPPRSSSAGSWATSRDQPSDYIQGISGEGTSLSTLLVDPINTGNYYYRYYVYSAGSSGCESIKGPFYVLQVYTMESGDHPNADSPGWSCPNRDWSTEADYVVGGFTH
ncbi:MAG: prepilin-type N-terminal cleavage/methylation domain-containing protein [bacterium]|nr:prepilin-type N-terminal cleavage/methylation domain-containing protein [bacterium]MDN5835204.1 prepilin-type N-terminal cleavage/methylation domain-containing protein [bacterium]